MTETQHKQIAVMVLADNEKIDAMLELLTNIIERRIPEGEDFGGREVFLLSQIDQLSALNRTAGAMREELRNELGLQFPPLDV